MRKDWKENMSVWARECGTCDIQLSNTWTHPRVLYNRKNKLKRMKNNQIKWKEDEYEKKQKKYINKWKMKLIKRVTQSRAVMEREKKIVGCSLVLLIATSYKFVKIKLNRATLPRLMNETSNNKILIYLL